MSERSPVNDAVAHYESLFRRHGAVPGGVGWNSERAQTIRFEKLIEILPEDDVPLSLLDFGCGFGSLGELLSARRSNVTYIGYDASTEMIDSARARSRDPRARFVSDWSSVPPCDYAVASGIFNVRGTWPADEWWRYILDTLRSIHERTSIAWSANFLTAYSDPELMSPELYYTDPLALFDWCKRNLSPFVALHHDYPLYDFTIVVRKEQR